MLGFLNKLFKTKEAAVEKVQKPEPETEQKWNIKLGVYDTPLAGCQQLVLHGTGMEHYMDKLMALAVEDLNYTCTKKEMRDFLIINRRVYQYKFNPTSIDLVPEPENLYDRNAVKIVLNDLHVGYIRSSEAEGAADLFNSERVRRVQVSVQGGKYKILLGDGAYFDGSEPLSEFTMEKDEVPFSIKIYLDVARI